MAQDLEPQETPQKLQSRINMNKRAGYNFATDPKEHSFIIENNFELTHRIKFAN